MLRHRPPSRRPFGRACSTGFARRTRRPTAREFERLGAGDAALEVIYTLTSLGARKQGGLHAPGDEMRANVGWPAGDRPLAYVCGPTEFRGDGRGRAARARLRPGRDQDRALRSRRVLTDERQKPHRRRQGRVRAAAGAVRVRDDDRTPSAPAVAPPTASGRSASTSTPWICCPPAVASSLRMFAGAVATGSRCGASGAASSPAVRSERQLRPPVLRCSGGPEGVLPAGRVPNGPAFGVGDVCLGMDHRSRPPATYV
jgi:hypothetical protein